MIEYLLWAPDRATFVAVMTALRLPPDTPLATLDEDGETLIPARGVLFDEIGPVVATQAVLDDEGSEIEPAVIIPGYHVNCLAFGPVAAMLTDGMPDEGSIFERTCILDLLGAMEWLPITAEGIPEGYQGASGIRVFDPAVISSRYRVWA